MTTELHERITIKMFVGCLLTSDLQYHLSQSQTWKEWLLTQENSTAPNLQEVRFKNKTYLGSFCNDENVTISEVEELQHFIKSKFIDCCPSADLTHFKIYIFPQVFIS